MNSYIKKNIDKFKEFIGIKIEQPHFAFQDFLKDDTCIKVLYGEEENREKDNLQKYSSGKLSKYLKVTMQIPPNIYYRGISFSHIIFDGINLNHVCFHNCEFYFCEFRNITTHNPYKYSKHKFSFNAFEFCDFIKCDFNNCDFSNTLWNVGIFNAVTFRNTYFHDYSAFNRNSFINVQFQSDCTLYETCIIKPSGQFDVKFYSENGFAKVTLDSYVSDFDYKDEVNISDYQEYCIYKKQHYRDVASTYYGLEKLCESNCLMPQNVNYYYQRKKAETRSKSKLNFLSSYLCELVIGYGEYPFNSLVAMFIIILFFSFIYLFTGFKNIDGYNILYNFDIRYISYISKADVGNWFHSLYFSFFTLITVGQGSATPTTVLSQIVSSIELLIGAILITLFTATLFRKYTK